MLAEAQAVIKNARILEYLQPITEGKGDFLDGYDDGM